MQCIYAILYSKIANFCDDLQLIRHRMEITHSRRKKELSELTDTKRKSGAFARTHTRITSIYIYCIASDAFRCMWFFALHFTAAEEVFEMMVNGQWYDHSARAWLTAKEEIAQKKVIINRWMKSTVRINTCISSMVFVQPNSSVVQVYLLIG